MNLKDRESLTILLNQSKEIYQGTSRLVQWTVEDSEHLDDIMNSKEFQKDIGNRIARLTGSRTQTGVVPLLLILKAWQRTKAVYSFSRELVDDISRTDDTSLYISLLERLPFKDMLYFFPEEVFPMFEEEIAGMYVHLERHPGQVWVFFYCINRNRSVISRLLPGVAIEHIILSRSSFCCERL
ncbi:MAG: hypothetical protein IJI45_14605 [Anaerolineaceae bacterium]|nr:hypothetical protein [Anaerolineaceae bacterium]